MPVKKFIPFTHDDLELKNQLIRYAQDLAKDERAESQLACAVIYASFAEYVAKHILETLRHVVYENTYTNFAGILFIDERSKPKDRPLLMYDVIRQLRKYQFPDREEIVSGLDRIFKTRNNLLHNFAISNQAGLEKLPHDVEIISEESEELFRRVNIIYAGLQRILITDVDQESSNENETQGPKKETKRKK